jgi:hypothetical protein
MVARLLFISMALICSIQSPARAEHAAEASSAGARHPVAPSDDEVVATFLKNYRGRFELGRRHLNPAEQDRFRASFSQTPSLDRSLALHLMRTTDSNFRKSFGQLLLLERLPGLSADDLSQSDRDLFVRDPGQLYEQIFFDFIYLLATDRRVGPRFCRLMTPPRPCGDVEPHIEAAPEPKPGEKPYDPLRACYDRCRKEFFVKSGPMWFFNPSGNLWECMRQCDWDYEHGKLR